jgi:KaiC/GvpD/RAD55 family RecA-like ATPase
MQMATWLHDHKKLEKIGGPGKLAQLVDRTVTSVNIDRYAELVIEKFVRRQLIAIGNQTVNLAYEGLDLDEGLQCVEQSILEIAQLRQVEEGADAEFRRYTQVIEAIRDLELKIADPGYRAWKLQILAKRYERSPRQLEDLYFKSLIAEENEPMMDFDQMLAKHGSCMREWFVHGFLPKGSTILLHANGGTGKTKLAYDFIYHLATGSDWSGFPVTSPRRCMIIQADESPSDMLQSLWDRGISQGLPIKYKTKWTVDHIQQLRKEALEYKPEVLVIDSITAVSRNSLFSENDTEYARPVLLFRDLANEIGCTIIIIHHSNSQGEARGTRAIFNSVSEVWALKRTDDKSPDSTERFLTIEKSRSRKPAKYKLQFNPDDKSWSCLGKDGEEANSPNVRTKDAIITFLRQRQGIPYEAAEIHNAIGGSLGHVRRSAYDLAEEGVISRRQHQLGGAYTYFVGGVIMDDPPTIAHDHATITRDDHPSNLGREIVSAAGDHVIAENAIFETKTEPEESRSHDQAITSIEQPAEILDAVSGSADSATEDEVIASVGVRSQDQPITQHNQPVEVITATKPRKPTVNDRVKHFGGKCGTILAINKGLAKYEIQWDGGKTEVYSQKEFNKFDFEILSQSLNPEKNPLVTSQQVPLPLEESWEKYYRKFKIVCQKVVDGFGYFATVFHPSGAQVALRVPAIDAHSANEWIEQVLDQELLE